MLLYLSPNKLGNYIFTLGVATPIASLLAMTLDRKYGDDYGIFGITLRDGDDNMSADDHFG